MHYSRHFELSRAKSELEMIIPIVEDIVRLKKLLNSKGYDVQRHQYFGGIGPNGQKVFPQEMEQLVILVRELNERGIEIKDLDKGLIDFPHLRSNGEEVYLCYMLGEDSIIAWHPIEGGFAARRPLEEL
ncbi:MAG: DUF2203 domain-containing protein [Ignavibacteriota bacterium]